VAGQASGSAFPCVLPHAPADAAAWSRPAQTGTLRGVALHGALTRTHRSSPVARDAPSSLQRSTPPVLAIWPRLPLPSVSDDTH